MDRVSDFVKSLNERGYIPMYTTFLILKSLS